MACLVSIALFRLTSRGRQRLDSGGHAIAEAKRAVVPRAARRTMGRSAFAACQSSEGGCAFGAQSGGRSRLGSPRSGARIEPPGRGLQEVGAGYETTTWRMHLRGSVLAQARIRPDGQPLTPDANLSPFCLPGALRRGLHGVAPSKRRSRAKGREIWPRKRNRAKVRQWNRKLQRLTSSTQ